MIARHNLIEPILEVSVNTTLVFFTLVIRVLNGSLRIGTMDTQDFYIPYYFHKSGNVKAHVGVRQACRIYQVLKNSCYRGQAPTSTQGIPWDLTQRARPLCYQRCTWWPHSVLTWDRIWAAFFGSTMRTCSKCFRVCCLSFCSARTYFFSMLNTWRGCCEKKKKNPHLSGLCKILLLPGALGQRSHELIPSCERIMSHLFAIFPLLS